MATILRFFDRFKLKNEKENFQKIAENIERGIVFRGTNLWILAFAILIASLGLNINSTAVVIGAMLNLTAYGTYRWSRLRYGDQRHCTPQKIPYQLPVRGRYRAHHLHAVFSDLSAERRPFGNSCQSLP